MEKLLSSAKFDINCRWFKKKQLQLYLQKINHFSYFLNFKKCQTTVLNFSNGGICCFSLTFMTVNEGSLGFCLLVGPKNQIKMSLLALGHCDEHFFLQYFNILETKCIPSLKETASTY